jgi:CpcD/allophycocyanin linker domain
MDTNTNKKFIIKVTKGFTGPYRNSLGNLEYIVEYNQMSQKIKNIQKMGGTIISVQEIS